MSDWSVIDCEVVIHKSRKVSIQKIAEMIFDEYSVSLSTTPNGDCFIHTVRIAFSEGQDRAYREASKFLKVLTEDYKAQVTGRINISW